jgi:hypothetical protein
MATVSQKLGPGLLEFILSGTTKTFSGQVTNCRIEFPDSDAVSVLDGGELVDDSYTLAGTLLQDYTITGYLNFFLTHRGAKASWKFVPNTAMEDGTVYSGECNLKALNIGGDVKSRATSDFSFSGIGDVDYAEYTA